MHNRSTSISHPQEVHFNIPSLNCLFKAKISLPEIKLSLQFFNTLIITPLVRYLSVIYFSQIFVISTSVSPSKTTFKTFHKLLLQLPLFFLCIYVLFVPTSHISLNLNYQSTKKFIPYTNLVLKNSRNTFPSFVSSSEYFLQYFSFTSYFSINFQLTRHSKL